MVIGIKEMLLYFQCELHSPLKRRQIVRCWQFQGSQHVNIVYCGSRALASKHSTNLQYPVCRLECQLLTIYRESSFVGLWIAIESS